MGQDNFTRKGPSAATERKYAAYTKALLAAPKRAEPIMTRINGCRDDLTAVQRQCTGKLSFRSRAAVNKWIKAHPPGTHTFPVRPYQCTRCGEWHTTTSAQR